MIRAIHFAHAGRDAVLREASDVWWPRIYREVIEKTKSCRECRLACDNLKSMKSRNKFWKITIDKPAK